MGQVMNALVDLQVGWPISVKIATLEMNAQKADLIYIPPVFAPGFYVLNDSAVLIYKVTDVYSPEHDSGINWNSVKITWTETQPIVSPCDSELVAFADLWNPFRYTEEATHGG